MFKSVLSKYVGQEKSSAFLPVKWERSYISDAFIISYFDCNVLFFFIQSIYKKPGTNCKRKYK
jgi:hypothetical protein